MSDTKNFENAYIRLKVPQREPMCMLYHTCMALTSPHNAAFSDLARLGARVRSARQERGLTQRELSTLTGITRLRIIAIERGEGTVAIEAYAIVARTLGISLRATGAQTPTVQ